jgi:hypothetical protein
MMKAHAERTATKVAERERERPAPVQAVRRAPAVSPAEPAVDVDALMPVPAEVAGAGTATRVRRSPTAADVAHTPADITSRIRQAPAGRPLETTVQRRLEGALDTSLSDVRVHTDQASDGMARDINARAFATGSDIYFRSGEYRPNDRSGLETIAHEVVHTTQQSGGSSGTRIGRMHLSDPNDRDEREASAIASKIVRGTDTGAEVAPTGEARIARATVRRSAATTRIRRVVGEATRLRAIDTDYANEETVQRPDLRNVVLSYGQVISATWNTMQALPGANDPGALATAKDLLKTCPALCNVTSQNPTPLRVRIDALDKVAALAEVKKVHDTQLEKAQLQDIVVDAQGNIDMAALNSRLVEYDHTTGDQLKTLVTVSGGKLKRSTTHAQAGLPVDTGESVTQHSGKGWEIFVVGATGDIHMASHKIGKYHHSSLLAGANVSMAGEMKVTGGKIVTMSNKSGHYNPSAEHFQHFLRTLEGSVPLDFNVTGWGVLNGRADAWLAGLADSQTPENLDTATVWTSLGLQGKPVEAYLLGGPPAGLGWRRKVSPGSQFEKPTSDPAVWKPVSHDEVRTTVEAKFGKAKKKVEGNSGGVAAPVKWL